MNYRVWHRGELDSTHRDRRDALARCQRLGVTAGGACRIERTASLGAYI